MKNMLKVVSIAVMAAVAGGAVYMMQDHDTKKMVGKKAIKAMNSAEDMISKKIN